MPQALQCGGVVTYQLLAGREVAQNDRTAKLMANYMYLIVNTLDRTAIAVDVAWDVEGVYALADRLGVKIRGVVYTHFHFDHCGGHVPPEWTGGEEFPPLPGAKEVESRGGEIWAGAGDAEAIRKQCRLESVTPLQDGSCLECGDLVLHTIATPGHTVGSICVFATPQCLSPRGSLKGSLEGEVLTKAERGLLITGDTLFVGNVGRVDLPESNAAEMMQSLSRIGSMHPEVLVLPGHDYGRTPFSTIGSERAMNLMVQSGLSQVPSPPPLPPCCCGDDLGRSCGPRGFIIGRKVRIAGLRDKGAGGEEDKGAKDVGVLQRFEEAVGQYAVRLLPSGEVVQVPPDRLAAASKKPAL